MKSRLIVFAVGIACSIAQSGGVWAEDVFDQVAFPHGTEIAPVDDSTLDSQVGLGPGADSAIHDLGLQSDVAVILWDEAKPRGPISSGHGAAAGQVSASVSVSVSGG